MAQSKQRRRFRLRTWFMLAALPLVIWAVAFAFWLYWPVLRGWYGASDQGQPSRGPSERAQRGSGRAPPTGEKISDDERKKLEEVLRRRN